MDITQELNKKSIDLSKVTEWVIEHPESIQILIEGLLAPKGTLRYRFEKVRDFDYRAPLCG